MILHVFPQQQSWMYEDHDIINKINNKGRIEKKLNYQKIELFQNWCFALKLLVRYSDRNT